MATHRIIGRVCCMHQDHEDELISFGRVYHDEEYAFSQLDGEHGELHSQSLSIDTKNGWPCDDAWVDDIYLETEEGGETFADS